jgi:Pvc16 N-terminal domain
MSFAALNEVTRALRMLLHSQLAQASASAVVTLLPPGVDLPEVSGVNLYLYRVVESPSTKNRPWPGDRTTPPSARPALGLELSYLLTPLGTRPDDASFQLGDDAHTMLGVAMLTLQEHPILNDVHLPGFDADVVLPPFLRQSFEQIKVTLAPTNLEELSKIWATINQPYRLSVAYDVSLVQLTPTPPPPVNGGIVLSTGVNVIALDAPRPTALTPASGALAHVDGGGALVSNELRIAGSGFSFPGQPPVVRVGGQPVPIETTPAPTDTALSVRLPTDLDAGPQADVRVSLNGRTSTPLAFTVTPWLALVTPIRTALDPTRPADLTLTLSGNGFTTAPRAVRLEGPGGTTTVTAFGPGGADDRATVTLPTTLASGLYRVRLVLDDPAGSASNSRTLEVIPRLDSPIGLAQTTVGGNQVHQLTLNGARLNGSDARVRLDRATYQIGASTNAAQLVLTLGHLLVAGAHEVAVTVDGQTSRAVTFHV